MPCNLYFAFVDCQLFFHRKVMKRCVAKTLEDNAFVEVSQVGMPGLALGVTFVPANPTGQFHHA